MEPDAIAGMAGVNLVLDSKIGITMGSSGNPTEYLACSSKEKKASIFDKIITVSFDYECNIENGFCTFNIETSYQMIKTFNPEDNGNGRIVVTLKTNAVTEEQLNKRPTYILYLQRQGAVFSGSVTVKNVKLEYGTVTDPIWTPAPEDYVALAARVAALEAAKA